MERPKTPPISEICATCPVLKKYAHELAFAKRFEGLITDSYKHGVQEVFADALMRDSENDPDFQGADALNRDELISEFVTEQGRELEAIEQRAALVGERIELLQFGCAGIVRLRGVKNAMEYTVEICGSHEMDETERGVEEVVRVKRKNVD